jgi:hypothetical protein
VWPISLYLFLALSQLKSQLFAMQTYLGPMFYLENIFAEKYCSKIGVFDSLLHCTSRHFLRPKIGEKRRNWWLTLTFVKPVSVFFQERPEPIQGLLLGIRPVPGAHPTKHNFSQFYA